MATKKWFTIETNLNAGVIGKVQSFAIAGSCKLQLRDFLSVEENQVGIVTNGSIAFPSAATMPRKLVVLRKLTSEPDTSFRAIHEAIVTGQAGLTEEFEYTDMNLVSGLAYTYRMIAFGEGDLPTYNTGTTTPTVSIDVTTVAGNFTDYMSYLIRVKQDGGANSPSAFGANGLKVPLELWTNNAFNKTGPGNTLYANGFRDIVNGLAGTAYTPALLNIFNYKYGNILRKKVLNTTNPITISSTGKLKMTGVTALIGAFGVDGTLTTSAGFFNAGGGLTLVVGDVLNIALKNDAGTVIENLVAIVKDNSVVIPPTGGTIATINVRFTHTNRTFSVITEGTDYFNGQLISTATVSQIVISDTIASIDEISEIEDWFVEVYYTTKTDLDALDIGTKDDVIDDSEDIDFASDSNPEISTHGYVLGYRGKSFTPIITLPIDYTSVKGISATLVIKWKRSEIAQTSTLINVITNTKPVEATFDSIGKDIAMALVAGFNCGGAAGVLKGIRSLSNMATVTPAAMLAIDATTLDYVDPSIPKYASK